MCRSLRSTAWLLVGAAGALVLLTAGRAQAHDCQAPVAREIRSDYCEYLRTVAHLSLPNKMAFTGTEEEWEAHRRSLHAERDRLVRRLTAAMTPAHRAEILAEAFVRAPAEGDGVLLSATLYLLAASGGPRDVLRDELLRTLPAWERAGYSRGNILDIWRNAM